LKIALVQQHATKNKLENVTRGLRALDEAVTQGAELICYPELAFNFFLPQYPATSELLRLAEPIPGPTTDLFSRKAEKHGVVVILNLFERAGSKTYDTSPVINSKGEIIGKPQMIHILEAPNFHEKGYYSPGSRGIHVFDTIVGRIGIAICYDRHFPEHMRELALKGAELVVVPQAGAVDEWPAGIFEGELQVAAFQNGYFIALANRVGKEDAISFAGESFVTNPFGKVIARAPKNIDCILYADIDVDKISQSHAKKHFLLDRRPRIYQNLVKSIE